MSRLPHSKIHMVHRIGWLRAAVLGANDGIAAANPRPLRLRAQSAPERRLDHLGPKNSAAHPAVQMIVHFAVTSLAQNSNVHAREETRIRITGGRRGTTSRLLSTTIRAPDQVQVRCEKDWRSTKVQGSWCRPFLCAGSAIAVSTAARPISK
jgi:hypothetical protein